MPGFLDLSLLKSRPTGGTLPRCGLCGLLKKCRSPKMPVAGKGEKRILVVGEAPGAEEDDKGIPFVGKTGTYLRDTLAEVGIDLRRDCWLTNSLICRPPKNTVTDERMIDWCRPNLLKTIEELQPETIVLLGARALKSLIAWLWKEDAGEINKWAGFRIPCQRLNAWVCPTWHPSFVVRENETRRDGGVTELVWKRHLKAAFRTGRPWSEVPSYASCVRTELNPERAAAAIRRLTAFGRVLAFDYENTTLKPDGKHARIYCCAISDGEESIAYPWHGEAITASIEFLRSPVPKIGFNVKHEQRYSRANLGVKVRNFVWDGMLAAHVLDNRSDTKSLKFQAFVLLGQESYDDAIKPYLKSKGSNDRNRITELDLEAVLRYCGMDAILEWHVAMKQAKKLGVTL